MFPTFCRITGNSRNLPKPNYFPLLPPISPGQAKQFQTGCRITCNFNPNHHYVPITKFIDEAVVKCKITEKSQFEYKFFLRLDFGSFSKKPSDSSPKNASSTNPTKCSVSPDREYFYYELEDRILVLPKSFEKELNRGAIKDVQISEDKSKIGFRYINTIKEYDLLCESTDKLQELNPVKGKGLKKVRRKRKKSALFSDLTSIFEQKERLAELAEKRATERIQPDASKIELVKSKISQRKAPVFGYMDHNDKFTEIHGEDDILPKHAIKGQFQSGVFTPGDLFNEIFIPGKYIDHVFTPGIVKDGEFIPGSYIEKDVGGKKQKKFIPGKVMNGLFTPGQIIKSATGTSAFVPGQVLTFENNVKKFVPGTLIEQVENDVIDFKFVPGKVEEKNNTLLFTHGELVETHEGLKFICEKVEKDGFEIQTFDNTFDFDYEDVKAAVTVCETLNEFIRPDIGQSSFDTQDSDTRSVCTTISGGAQTNATSSRKASVDFLDVAGRLDDTLVGDEKEYSISTSHQYNNLFLADKERVSLAAGIELCVQECSEQTFVLNLNAAITSVYEKVKAKAATLIQRVCSEMSLSDEETAVILDKVLQGLKKQEMTELSSFHSSWDGMEIDSPDASTEDLIFEKVTQHVASVIQPVFAQLKTDPKIINRSCKQETVANAIKQLVAGELLEVVVNQAQSVNRVTINLEKAKRTVPTLVQKVFAEIAKMASASNPPSNSSTTLKAVEEVVLDVIKESEAQYAAIMMNTALMDPQKGSILRSTIQATQKAQIDIITKKLCSKLALNQSSTQEVSAVVERVLQELSQPQVLSLICDEVRVNGGSTVLVNGATKNLLVPSTQNSRSPGSLKESASSEKVLEDCKKLLVEAYSDAQHPPEVIMGESEEKAADLLKDHVELQLTRDFNEALLQEALHLAHLLRKEDVIKELEMLLLDDASYEAVVNDPEVLFLLRQLVILKKLMATKKSSQGNGSVRENFAEASGKIDHELLIDSQMLTEYVYAQEERERYLSDVPKQQKASSSFQAQRTGVQVYMEESSSFFSSNEGTTHSKRARLTTTMDDPDFDDIMEPVELLDNSFARHKIEMARSRHQSQSPSPNAANVMSKKSSKIALKSADELQSTTSEQLALINREATLRELIETEEEFVRDLGYVIENYYKHLALSGNKLAKYRELFGSLKPIYEFHQGILLEGFKHYSHDANCKMIGRTFLRLERYFDNHASYISEEEPNAQAMLREDSDISEYFEELTLSLGDEKSLSDHLKLPLQRINDYQLILQDLIDIQRILKEDTADLEKALDLLLAIPQKIGDKKFLSNIEGFHGNVFHLGRLIRHDWFTVTREDVDEVKQRYVFLFKARILVTKVRKISDERSVFVLKDIIKLPEYSLEVVSENKFILRGLGRVYVFESPSVDIASEWEGIIHQCLQPEIAAAQRTEENLRQLKREGSIRRSRHKTDEVRRASAIDHQSPKVSVQEPRKSSEPAIRGVTIEEITLQEAESFEKATASKERIINITREEPLAEEAAERSQDFVQTQSAESKEQSKLTKQTSVKSDTKVETGESAVSASVTGARPSDQVCAKSAEEKEQEGDANVTLKSKKPLLIIGSESEKHELTKAYSELLLASEVATSTTASETKLVETHQVLNQAELGKEILPSPAKVSTVDSSKQQAATSEKEAEKVKEKVVSATEVSKAEYSATEIQSSRKSSIIQGSPYNTPISPQASQATVTKSETLKESVEAVENAVAQSEKSKPGVADKQGVSSSTKEPDNTQVKADQVATETEQSQESKRSSLQRKESAKKAVVEQEKDAQQQENQTSAVKRRQSKKETATQNANESSSTISAEEARKLRRRSSVIQSSDIMESEAPPPVFVKPLRSVECEPGDNASFECVTDSTVIITWLKGNRPLADTLADRVKITSKDNKHTLTLLNCRDEDTGLYTAKITNEKFGVATSSAVLTVHELTAEERKKKIQELNSPQFLVKFHNTELLKDTRVSFMFVVKGNPEPTLMFYHDGMILQESTERTKIMKQPDDTYEFSIDKICEDDAGEYRVVATNKHGSAEVTAKVYVVEEKELFKGIEGRRMLTPGEEPLFDWFLNGRPFTPDEKLKVLFKEDEDTLALIFQHVTPDDAGLYTCIAQTSQGKISCSAELTVQGAIHQLLKEPCPPTITAELTDTEVNAGGSAMLELKVSGYPKPQVTWYKNGKEELVAGGRFRFLYEDDESIALIIKNVTKEDAGMYVVKAVNDLGEVETKGRLIVKAPPRFMKKMVNMSCMTEEKLAMEVIVDGSPKPEVKWYKDGQLIIASERIKFTELEDGRFQITIERVTLEDSGAYSVVASNAIGQMSEFWNLVAHQPAKIIRKLPKEHTTDLGTKGNQLNFSVQGVPEPTVVCTSSTGKQLKVDNLGGGEYRVNFDCTERQNIKIKAEAKNEHGTDTSECQVYVRRSAQIVSKLQNVEVKEGDDVTVKVKVDSHPKPDKVKWFIDGIEISGKKYETSDSGDEYCLKLKGVERKDASNKLDVKVQVENELGKDECSASITIKSKPKIKKGLDAKYRLVENSKTQELNVEVDAATFPEPKGTWYHNGKEVEADARIKITKKSSETYNLTFNVIKYEDAGEWSFKAENEVGEVWSKTTIIVEGKPTFKKGLPENVEVIVSEKMELDVIVQDFCEENVKITWTLDSDIKLESSEVRNKEDSTTASKIHFVPTAGCQKLTVTATNKHGETESRSELIHVNLNPPIIKKPLEKEVFIKDGQKNVVLKVEVDGSPPPKLSWCLNGEPILQGTNELIIPVFSAANVGQYTLEAVNVAGSASTGGAVKMLQTKPSFIKGLEPNYLFKEGLDDLVLSVDVDGSPIPQVVWMKDGEPISPESDPRVSITNADGKSTLRVKNIDPKDKGRYSVCLKNPNGACEASTSVAIKPTPRAPLLVDPLEYPKDINKKQKLEIKTKIDGEPMPTVTFLHNGKPLPANLWKLFPDGTLILTIDNVQPENAGVYSLKLENEAGVKQVDTEPITVHEPPQRPGIDPPLSTIRVVEGLPFKFTAGLKGYPLPELSLEKDDQPIADILYDKEKKHFEYGKSVAKPQDAGVYKLIAKNASGQVVSEGRLDVVSKVKDGPKYEPKFIYELCDKKVDEGNELVLMAKVDGNPLPAIRWEFNGSPLSPEQYPQTFDGEKAILRIPIAERGHEGVFKCILENDEGKAESASNVTVNRVYRPPSFVQKFADQEQIPSCDCKFGARISGVPAPTVQFFKDGVEISPNDKYKIKHEGDLVQLFVKNCTDADKGLYTCKLTNKEGSAECKAKLDIVEKVTHKPRSEIPYFLKTIGNTEVYPGMMAKFTACVGGFPDPEFEWFRNGNEKVFESDRIKFERDGAGSGLIRLIIKDVDIGDLADYTLRIWNEHGDAECSAYLRYDSLADLNKQKLGDLYSGYEDTRPTAIPNRPVITHMSHNWATLKWNPCLPHASRIPCTYLVERCSVDQPDSWTTIYKGLKNNYCDVEFPNPNMDYKFRVRVQWGPSHISEPSPYAITMRNKFDTRPPHWKPMLVPSIPRSYDLSRPPHEGYTHAPRFLNREHDYQYGQLGHPASLYFSVYGYPKPTLKFFKDGQEFNPQYTYLDNGLITVFLNRMSDEMEGCYECEAKNSLGIARQQVYLRRADHPRFITRPQEVYGMVHRSVKLSARIYGIPVPDIKVYKDWHLMPLTSETRIKLQTLDVDAHTIDVVISIEEVMMRDEGLYSIVATNVAGFVHSSAMIHVEEMEADYYFKGYHKGKDVRFRNINVRNYYDFGDEIGRGTQAVHHHVVERASGKSYASKTMITRYDPRRKGWVENEYNMWNGLNHRYISRLHDAFYHDDTYILISDICTGGDILHSLISRDSFTEYEICFFIKQLLEGLEYLHVMNHMAHLSLTPLDLLLTHINSDALRIIDFSLARKNWNTSLEYGQPEYVAPEIVRGEKHVGPWSDMWAVGIITYVLLSGHSPFLGLNDRETLENVKNGAWTFADRFELISDTARDFISKLLVYDFKDRFDVTAALKHRWFDMLLKEPVDLPNILRDSHSSYYYKLKAWNENASCRTIFRRNPLQTAYTDPTKMVYPPNYNEDDDYKHPIPSTDHLKLNGYPRPEIDDFVSESHYQSGEETYLLQLRDTDFPARLRQYMKVAASHSPSFQFQVYNHYAERNIPVIRERRKYTDVMDEEVDDERCKTPVADGVWNPEPRRIRYEVGTRLDFQAEADALRSMKRDGKNPVFREKPTPYVTVKLGQEVTLKVVSTGDPVPGIQWFKNDMIVLSPGENKEIEEDDGSSTLTFREIRETDLTNYKIVARNKSGQIISRFRLRLSDEPADSVPETINYEIETAPVCISTQEIACSSPLELITHGKFGSVVLAENSRLLKVCTELEFNTTKKLAHVNLFAIYQATQIGSSILLEDNCLNYEASCNLLHYVSSLDSYSEQLLLNFVSQILDGLQYLHWHDLVLLNLEPGNVLVTRNKRVKLVDFSATQPVLKIGSRVDCLTDPEFTAPEVLNGESQCMSQTDTWNIGILIYIMLSGASPFLGETEEETRQNVTFVRFRFEHLYKNVSQEATRLIMLIFKRSPLKRPTADECLEHRWFQLSDHMTKKREKAVFDTVRIKEYYVRYLEGKKALQGESNLQDFTNKYGTIG